MKDVIRKQMLQTRKNLSFREVESASEMVFLNLLKIKDFNDAQSCFCYCDFKNEVQTNKIRELFATKTLYIPLIKGDVMYAVQKKGESVTFNGYGIEEPKEYEIITKSADISIIPLVACDKTGNRIGFGKGYYDKYLKDKNTLKIGICYSWQIVDFIQKTYGDISLDYIVTEQEIIKVK